MLGTRTITRREPKWRKCEACKAQFCVATKSFKGTRELGVKYCPSCGAGEASLQRWIFGYPPWPDAWC